MSGLKLYRCEVEFVYYVLAESDGEAKDFAKDAAGDLFLPEFTFCTESDGKHAAGDGWERGALVYHDGREDITVEKAIEIARKGGA